jgi:hypothetical protein
MMAKFAVRVELDGPEGNAYDQLHDLMATVGFVRTVEVEGNRFLLLPGEYRRYVDSDPVTQARDVVDEVVGLVKRVHRGAVTVLAARADNFDQTGPLELAPPVFHAQGPVSSRTKCGIGAPSEEIRPSRSDAEDQIGRRLGRLCTLCW